MLHSLLLRFTVPTLRVPFISIHLNLASGQQEMLLLELEKDLLNVKPKEKFLVLTTCYKKILIFQSAIGKKATKTIYQYFKLFMETVVVLRNVCRHEFEEVLSKFFQIFLKNISLKSSQSVYFLLATSINIFLIIYG
jgi:hypothetical protein